ncbi:curli biogenesis system outer membrane secretion channel CsgG [Halanaerobium saccharolyticum]|jgi:curli biogenesis system outer membrane secretion channel CsgG|uniref:Curli biogenesis system outer membrane secretion channel CsgG n=1 Tax=Halanaerobium saccharolyticum TaxID=43595 RepID=A0A2T5RJ36_9FIRM|nr:CsgG/HfaB family protein [Halanaerobium saccharolyticum]PTV98487.1 curli biogenesis system outer membrane secretion channel CsgG [Halanaerobium saccharolyticum]
MEEMIALLLVVSLFAGGSTGLMPEKNRAEELAVDPTQVIEEVRISADQIITSQENVTTATQLLAALPEREDKHQVAIYDIKDKTGQYSEIGSMVVSQGATEMLITALIRSRQFKVLDRVNLSNFMTEQSLVEQDRTTGNDGPATGELTGAHYVIDGAITEYQIDKKTGGLGLVIAGKGGQQEYAVASCAVDLRVTDTTSGEVVWAKSLKKEIVGERISFQVFSFMGNNIVEFESGRGKQEVINLVVRTLLEEAVYKLSTSDLL